MRIINKNNNEKNNKRKIPEHLQELYNWCSEELK